MNVDAYFKRIKYLGPAAPTAKTLRALQTAHLLAVPFENLSIHAGHPIVLEDDALFSKIVEHRRGGFCYELNGLFAALLRALGFKVEMLSAGVANAQGDFGPDFDHMTLMVSLEERWLVDVGFGDSFTEPLRLGEREVQIQGRRAYKIEDFGEYLVLMQRENEGDWKAQFRFTLKPYKYADYIEMCDYHQSSPDSHFTQRRICTRAKEEGRLTLSEMRLIATSKNGDRQEQILKSTEEYKAALRENFDIVLKE